MSFHTLAQAQPTQSQQQQPHYPTSHSFGGLGNYSGYSQSQPGLARYGQSLSSENLDLNNIHSFPPAPYNNHCNQLDVNDPRLLQQVDQIVANLVECKRPILRRQVITVPSQCPGRIAYITRRLPTPPPDIIERINVVKPPRDIVNLCIEKPVQPGPCYQERNVCGKPRKPIIQPRIISVQPRHNPCQQSSQQCPPCPPCPPSQQAYQAQVPLTQSASYGNVQIQTNTHSAQQQVQQPAVSQQQPAYNHQVYAQQYAQAAPALSAGTAAAFQQQLAQTTPALSAGTAAAFQQQFAQAAPALSAGTAAAFQQQLAQAAPALSAGTAAAFQQQFAQAAPALSAGTAAAFQQQAALLQQPNQAAGFGQQLTFPQQLTTPGFSNSFQTQPFTQPAFSQGANLTNQFQFPTGFSQAQQLPSFQGQGLSGSLGASFGQSVGSLFGQNFSGF